MPYPGLDAAGGQPPAGSDGGVTDAGVDASPSTDTNGGPEAAASDGPPVTLPRMLIRRDIRPRDTDMAIDKWPDNHVAVVDGRVPSQGKLFLFLPGGNGVPSGTVDMLNEAASYGFHTLGLSFATDELVGDDCPGDPDPGCAGKHRTEVIEGEDLSSHLQVSRAKPIQNRLGKALAHLHQRWPAEGWGQYVDGTTARWSLIIAAGRSLGGAVSARIAQLREVHRADIDSAPGIGYRTTSRRRGCARPARHPPIASSPSCTPATPNTGSSSAT